MPIRRESLVPFAKTLLTTFLGLLMALGLESWNRERLLKRAARTALASVLREVADNRKSLQRLATTNQDLPRNLGLAIAALESLQDARAQHQPWQIPDQFGNLSIYHSAGSLKGSAWSMALADQSVQRFPKAQVEALADFYQQLGRFQVFLDQPVDYSSLTALGAGTVGVASVRQRLERLSPAELERILWNLRELKVRFEMVRMWAEGVGEIPAISGN